MPWDTVCTLLQVDIINLDCVSSITDTTFTRQLFLVTRCWILLCFFLLFSFAGCCLLFVPKTCQIWQNTCVYTFPELPWSSLGFSAFPAFQASAGNVGPPAFVNIAHWKHTLGRQMTSSMKAKPINHGLRKTCAAATTSRPIPEAQSRMFVCEMCSATFGKASARKSHVNSVHLKMYRFFCDVCSKGFAVKEHCIDHMNMHNNIKAHQCSNCSRSFTFKTHLRRHLRFGVCNKNKLSSPDKIPLTWRYNVMAELCMQNSG